MIEPSELERLLRAAFPDAEVLEVEDLTGSKDHYQATIVSGKFRGLSRVAQHQAVYAALGDLMKGPIHALALNTSTPESNAKKRLT
jgi:stress-induced morphogen